MEPLRAIKFTSMSGITIVRLASESLMAVEEQVCNAVGLHLLEEHSVGEAPTRTMPFPTQLIIADPAHTHHALNLLPELEGIRADLGTKKYPNPLHDRVDRLIAMLGRSVPHFIPPFLEELAHLSIQEGELEEAQEWGSRAYEIERIYALDRDPQQRTAALTEFIRLGAVSLEEFSREAHTAGERMAPRDAFDYFLFLLIQRSSAGSGIDESLLQELNKLADAAISPQKNALWHSSKAS